MDDESHPLSPRERADIQTLAKFFDSIHLQDGGDDNDRSSAVRFLLWGISPYIKMISSTLRRLAETGTEGLENFVAAARVLAGEEGDNVDEEDPSMSSTHSTSMQANLQCTQLEIWILSYSSNGPSVLETRRTSLLAFFRLPSTQSTSANVASSPLMTRRKVYAPYPIHSKATSKNTQSLRPFVCKVDARVESSPARSLAPKGMPLSS